MDTTIAKPLLATGQVDADHENMDGYTPLYYVVRNSHEEAVKLPTKTMTLLVNLLKA